VRQKRFWKINITSLIMASSKAALVLDLLALLAQKYKYMELRCACGNTYAINTLGTGFLLSINQSMITYAIPDGRAWRTCSASRTHTQQTHTHTHTLPMRTERKAAAGVSTMANKPSTDLFIFFRLSPPVFQKEEHI